MTSLRTGRTAAVTALTAGLVVGWAAAAWAQPTASPAEVQADSDVTLTFDVPEHDGEEFDETETVIVVTPTSFELLGCTASIGWSCSTEGRNATFERDGEPADLLRGPGVESATFTTQVHTATTNGTYAFPVSQRDGDGTAVNWQASNGTAPTVTVVQGDPEPEPEPSEEPSEEPGGGLGGGVLPSEDPSEEPSEQPTTTPDPDPGQDPSPQPTGSASPRPSPSPSASASEDDGSTQPRRTQRRTTGGSIEIQPGTSDGGGDDPAVAQPDVADDDGTVGGASDGVDEALGEPEESGGGGGLPWQTVVGGLMMLSAAGVGVARAVQRRRA